MSILESIRLVSLPPPPPPNLLWNNFLSHSSIHRQEMSSNSIGLASGASNSSCRTNEAFFEQRHETLAQIEERLETMEKCIDENHLQLCLTLSRLSLNFSPQIQESFSDSAEKCRKIEERLTNFYKIIDHQTQYATLESIKEE
ncbi:MAG: hypothetical protein MHMPM18_002079 [Marteilia pararefringens]